MNIFVVHENPVIAAHQLCDKHVVKMIVEGCQMLSTIHRMCGSHVVYAPVELYKASFHNHPCTIWARKTTANYFWLANHTNELSLEYTRRYGKTHLSHSMTKWFIHHAPLQVPFGDLTPFAQAMPDQYKCNDGVTAYRNYYIFEKSRFAKWKFTEVPKWYSEGLTSKQTVLQ